MDVTVVIPLVAFWALLGGVLLKRSSRVALFSRRMADWVLDLSGLAVQGTVVPLVETFVVFAALNAFFPQLNGSLRLPAAAAFLLNVVVVDYLYYWNHRLLHTRALWRVHIVHHTLPSMDVVGTSRNTLWSSFFIIYVWVNGALLFLVDEKLAFGLGAAVTAALDLWRHSSLGPSPSSTIGRWLSMVFILPAHHAWHHARAETHGNYGANFALWDRLHGTYVAAESAPDALGVDDGGLSLSRRLFWPFPAKGA